MKKILSAECPEDFVHNTDKKKGMIYLTVILKHSQ